MLDCTCNLKWSRPVTSLSLPRCGSSHTWPITFQFGILYNSSLPGDWLACWISSFLKATSFYLCLADHPDGPQVPLHRGDPHHCLPALRGQCPLQPPFAAGWSTSRPEEIHLEWRGSHHAAEHLPSFQKHQWQSGKCSGQVWLGRFWVLLLKITSSVTLNLQGASWPLFWQGCFDT